MTTSGINRLYRKKQSLYYEEAPASGVYVVRSGQVKVFKTGPEGKELILRIAKPGDLLGVESVLSGRVHGSSAEMLEDGEVAFVDKAVFLDQLQRDPKLSAEVMHNLASELMASQEERVDLAQSSVRERMAKLLATFADRHGAHVKNGIRIRLFLSREEMADMIGTASETAMRLLKDFREEKVLEVHGREILVLDRNRLLRTAGLEESRRMAC